MLTTIFERFIKKSPITVMTRALIARVFCPAFLDDWFANVANQQYTRTLLLSSLFDLMSGVVCGMHKTVGSAYQASEKDIGVSVQSVYNKLKGVELSTSAELVRHTAEAVSPLIQELGGTHAPLFPGYRVKILDGNCLAATEHRLKELRGLAAGALPGKSLVVYEPALGIPTDVFPCADGHAQERALLGAVLRTVEADDVWIADRNMCTRAFTCGIDDRQAYCVIREHEQFPWRSAGPEVYVGQSETGPVYEQPITVTDDAGQAHAFRRIRVALTQATRNDDVEVSIISNLPHEGASALNIAESYRKRWTIETAFQEVTEQLHSEITTLGYPPAALFGFCVALVVYMLFQVTRAALSHVHGVETVEEQVSGHYLTDEVSGTYRGMMIALPDDEWQLFGDMSTTEFVAELVRIASHATLSKYRKHPRGPKKPSPKKHYDKKTPHVSTARLLRARS